jgi:hypothetical protein
LRYRSNGKEDYKKFQPRESREYNPSPEDMLNGPCHIHCICRWETSIQTRNERLHYVLETIGSSTQQASRSKMAGIRRKHKQRTCNSTRKQWSSQGSRSVEPGTQRRRRICSI